MATTRRSGMIDQKSSSPVEWSGDGSGAGRAAVRR